MLVMKNALVLYYEPSICYYEEQENPRASVNRAGNMQRYAAYEKKKHMNCAACSIVALLARHVVQAPAGI